MKALVCQLWTMMATRLAHFLALLAPLMWIWLALIPVVHADGGAPNLAYVAGAGSTGSDLAVVDIAQRHLTWRIAIGGTPAGVVLNADGHFAYVTEASAGVLAGVDASEGRVTSTINIGPSPGALAIDFNRQHPLL
jgi:DNA-binding beta-propeller fold protein YncE